MRYLKKFKMFESVENIDFNDVFPTDLISDIYDLSTEYFDEGLSLLVRGRIGDEPGFSYIFNHKSTFSDMILDVNNYDEIIEEYENGQKPKIDFCIVDDFYIKNYNMSEYEIEDVFDKDGSIVTDIGDYDKYDNIILSRIKSEWPDYDLKISEWIWG